MNNSLSFPAEGRSQGLVRHVIGVSVDRSEKINAHIHQASRSQNRSAEYIAGVLSSVSKICETPQELAYAGYVAGIMLGVTAEITAAAAAMN